MAKTEAAQERVTAAEAELVVAQAAHTKAEKKAVLSFFHVLCTPYLRSTSQFVVSLIS
jgi:hypothetical protein